MLFVWAFLKPENSLIDYGATCPVKSFVHCSSSDLVEIRTPAEDIFISDVNLVYQKPIQSEFFIDRLASKKPALNRLVLNKILPAFDRKFEYFELASENQRFLKAGQGLCRSINLKLHIISLPIDKVEACGMANNFRNYIHRRTFPVICDFYSQANPIVKMACSHGPKPYRYAFDVLNRDIGLQFDLSRNPALVSSSYCRFCGNAGLGGSRIGSDCGVSCFFKSFLSYAEGLGSIFQGVFSRFESESYKEQPYGGQNRLDEGIENNDVAGPPNTLLSVKIAFIFDKGLKFFKLWIPVIFGICCFIYALDSGLKIGIRDLTLTWVVLLCGGFLLVMSLFFGLWWSGG